MTRQRLSRAVSAINALAALSSIAPPSTVQAVAASRPATAAAAVAVGRTVRPPVFPDAVIVGRSRCGDETWLLTAGLDLIDVVTSTAAVTARKLSGLATDDRPWGLACLDDHSLWTLANPRTLVRVTGTDGQVRERVALSRPRAALFAAGDRLLFQQLPVAPGTEALMTGAPQDPAAARVWPGFIQRARSSRQDEITGNLVNCGLGAAGSLPCWFVDDTRVVVSNGRADRTIDTTRLVPRLAPGTIHDVALTPDGFWLVGRHRDPAADRPVGTFLVYGAAGSGVRAELDLNPAARLVLAATDTRCFLLTADNTFVEVDVTQ
jgi:hypothetical protein